MSRAQDHDPELTYLDEPTLTGGPSPVRPGADGQDRARLLGVAGSVATRKFPVGDQVTIGRSSRADIAVEDPKLSRIHLRIRRDGDTYALEDLGSKNGTYVNRTLVTRTELRFGDEIRLGDTVFLFTHHNPVEDKLLHKQRMELLGRIGAGVAHDFNNLLGAALVSIDYLTGLPAERAVGDPEVVSCLTDIERALKRAAELSSRLLGVSRQHGYVLERLDLSALVREVGELVRRTLPRAIELRLEAPVGHEVMGDWGQLHQILMNLCVNARDAMPTGGVLEVSVRGSGSDPGTGRQVLLTVRDTGVGMDEATRQHAFDPFFTTKADEGGTGLGLATVLEIVKYHGGRVELRSQPGQGTEVVVSLPSAPVEDRRRVSETLQELPTMRPGAAAARALRVLVVDDNGAVRRSLARLLKARGYDVLSASDGAEGVRVFARERPDLVVMDLDMPVLAGPEAYRQIKELDPSARVVVMSGHSVSRLQATRPWTDAGPVLLQKPCGREDLERAIAEALGERTGSG